MPQQLQPLAVFDFDHTLVEDDSMWSFFALVAGWPQTLLALAQSFVQFVRWHFLHADNRTKLDRGTFFKQQMLTRLLAGRRVDDLRDPIARLRARQRWIEPMRRTLQDHYDQGHRIVIATGAFDLYMSELARDLPHHALLCTDVEIGDGAVTDIMPQGNCVREGKAKRVAAYIAEQGPFGESWGYGNFPDDVPMMNLLKHRIIV